jgi:hypothetical protein
LRGSGQAFTGATAFLTDEHVLRALIRQQRLTRAGLVAETGISSPTAGESVRRLADAGLVADIEPWANDGAVRVGRAWLGSEQAMTMPDGRCQLAHGWFVLVAGWPGSGKSTLAAALAAELGLPLLAKDEIKEAHRPKRTLRHYAGTLQCKAPGRTHISPSH